MIKQTMLEIQQERIAQLSAANKVLKVAFLLQLKEKNQLRKSFEKYKAESVKWSVEDFLLCEIDGWEITRSKAQQALEHMISHHDAEWGICWATIRTYIAELNYGRRVPIGKEYWRKRRKEFENLNTT